MESSNDSEEHMWIGKKSIDVMERKLVRYSFYSYLGGITGITVATFLTSYLNGWISLSLFIIFATFCGLVFFIMILRLKKAKKTTYLITRTKIIRKLGEKSIELLVNAIRLFKIKQTSMDIPELDTGTLLFYNATQKELQLKLSHIERVNEVAQIIQKLLDNIG